MPDTPALIEAPLLEVKDLEVRFDSYHGTVRAVNRISFSVARGQTLGIVGESGCGKSVTALSLMRLVQTPPGKIVDGQILFDGQDLLRLSSRQMDDIRGSQMAMVFQDPMTSLNPIRKVGDQIAESIVRHKGSSWKDAHRRAIECLELVRIPGAASRADQFPHEFSGGMRQRVMIAIALSCNPRLLIADEPTTALDVTIQAQILELLRELKDRLGMALIFITHDLGVVAGIADHIMVMYAGRAIESGVTREVFDHPRHPYTQGLLHSVPSIEKKAGGRLQSIPGSPPVLSNLPRGCSFVARCQYAEPRCQAEVPPLAPVGQSRLSAAGHQSACWLSEQFEAAQFSASDASVPQRDGR